MTTISDLPASLTTPADGDLMVVRDIDDATNKDKKITWANIKATLKTYFDTLYSTKAVVVGARVYNNADIACSDGAATALTFNTERFDTDALHSTGSNTGRLVAPVAGKYLISASIIFYGDVDGYRLVQLRLNGTTVIAGQMLDVDTTDTPYLTVTTVYQLAATDYVEVIATQTSGGSLSVRSLAAFSPEFSMVLLSS